MAIPFTWTPTSFKSTLASHVSVTYWDGTPVVLAVPVSVDSTGKISFSVSGTGRYTVSVKNGDGSESLTVSLSYPALPPANEPSLTIGSVVSGPTAEADISGGYLNLVLPKGDPGTDGQDATISIGSVSSGASASATIVGGSLNLVLPKGDPGIDGTTPDVSGKIDRDDTQSVDVKGSWLRRLTLGFTPASDSSDFFQLLIGGVAKFWQNEWGAVRGTSPYSWGDALIRAIRSQGDGITSGNFVELQDRRTGAAYNILYGRRWTDGALLRNDIAMADTYVTNSSSDPNIAKLPAGTVVVITP